MIPAALYPPIKDWLQELTGQIKSKVSPLLA